MFPLPVRTTLFRFLLLLGSVFVALVLAEVGLRLYPAIQLIRAGSLERQLERSRRASLNQGSQGHFTLRGLVQPSAHPDLVYEVKPRLDGDFKGGVLRTNSWGFRGPEVELAKPAGTRRIVGLGDSFMFGWGVHQDETYLTLLEQSLNARGGSGWQVLNLAVPGYNTTMEVASFAAKGLAFAPDLVIIHFFSNDLSTPYFMQHPKDVLVEKKGLFLVDLVRSALGGKQVSAPAARELVPRDRVQRYPEALGEVDAAYRHMVGEQGYRRAMKRLGDLTRERSIPVVVVHAERTLPYGDLVGEVAREQGFHLLRPQERFLAYLRARGREADQWEETFFVSERDIHLNKVGHALLAEALLKFILEHPGLLPP